MAEDTQREYPSAFREELKSLEGKLEERKETLRQEGAPMPEEKEIFRDVLKEHIEQTKPSASASLAPPVPLADDLKKKADDIKKREREEEQVRDIVEVALTRSIKDALRVAESATPWLLDELHDHLADGYYEKLLALKKVQPM